MPNLPAPPNVYLSTGYAAPTGVTWTATNSGNLQAALDAAQPGDQVVLTSGVVFTGNYTLANKTGSGYIVVRSSDARSLSPETQRSGPSYQPYMATILSNNLNPALATADSAHHWRIMGVEIGISPLSVGLYALVQIDTNNTSAYMPHDVILDRCYIHGNALGSCRRGVQLGGYNNSVIDSYLSNFHSVYGKGAEATGIGAFNGPGPYKIHGNYIEASTENVLFGGAVGPTGPMLPSDIEITGNYFNKPLAWRNGIIPSPQVSLGSAPGGTLPSGQYYYQVVANGSAGAAESGSVSIVSGFVEVTVQATLGSTPVLNWPAVTYGDSTNVQSAASYTIYRTQNAPLVGSPRTFVVFATQAGTTFSDTGSLPTTTFQDPNTPYVPLRSVGDTWMVKNHLEFKAAQRVLVEGNVFENCWFNAQGGTSILFTPRSTETPGMTPAQIAATFPGAVASDTLIQNNIIRHVGGGVAVASFDPNCTSPNRAISSRVYLNNNLLYDVSETYSFNGGSLGMLVYAPVDLTVNHNTLITSGQFSAARTQTLPVSTNETFSNNIMTGDLNNAQNPQLAGPAGFFQVNNINPVYQSNLLVKNQPYVDLAAWQAAVPTSWTESSLATVGWVDQPNGNYSLSPTSAYVKRGTDGKDLGVDYNALLAKTNGVVAGTANVIPSSVPGPVPLTPPTLTSLTPSTATAGSSSATVTINGSGFLNTSVVSWNGAPVTTSYVSASQLQATVLNAQLLQAGSVAVAVQNPNVALSAPLTFTVASPAPAPAVLPPTLASLSPQTAVAGSSATTLTITGSGFLSTAVVNWNGTAQATTFISSLQVSIALSAAMLLTASTATVTVANVSGGTASNALPFVVTAVGVGPAPVVTSLLPVSAIAGTGPATLTVAGSGFISTSVVQWNGTALPTVYVSTVQLSATVAAALLKVPGSATVNVQTPTLAPSNSLSFSITPVVVAPPPVVQPPAPVPAPPTIVKLPPITMQSLVSAVMGLLGSTDGVNGFWTAAEVQDLVGEALRTWNAATQYWRQRVAFLSTLNQRYYDLAFISPSQFGYRLQDRDVLNTITNHLLEPAVTGPTWAWTGKDQFTLADVLQAIERRRNQFLADTQIVVSRGIYGVSPEVPNVQLPNTTLAVRRVAFSDTVTGKVNNLWRVDEFQVGAFLPNVTNTPGVPASYSIAVTQPFGINIYPPPANSGNTEVISVQAPASPNLAKGVILGIPDDFVWAVKFGALADLLSKDGQAPDPQRAKYCESRYRQGVQWALAAGSVMQAQINDRRVQVSTLADFDAFNASWMNAAGQPTGVAMAGRNLVALDKAPTAAVGISVDAVINAPVPKDLASAVVISRDIAEAIVGFAEHLAAFKMGGAEFAQTLPLADMFFALAQQYNSRFQLEAPQWTDLHGQAQKEGTQRLIQ